VTLQASPPTSLRICTCSSRRRALSPAARRSPAYANRTQAVAVRKHLERNRKDKDSKFRLILIESRIHRLARYYKTVGVLPPNWKYESATASTMVA
jgi:hypothetical protein